MMMLVFVSSSLDTIALSSTGSNLGATDGGFADTSSGSGGGGDGGGGGGGGGVSLVGAGGGCEGGGSEGGGGVGGDEGDGGATTRVTLTLAAVATLVTGSRNQTTTPKREASCAAGVLTRVVAFASTVDVMAAAVAWLPSGAVSGMVRMTSTLMPGVEARRLPSAMRRPAATVARSSRKHAGSKHDSSFLRLASSVAFSGDASKEATSVASKAISKETTVEATETTA